MENSAAPLLLVLSQTVEGLTAEVDGEYPEWEEVLIHMCKDEDCQNYCPSHRGHHA